MSQTCNPDEWGGFVVNTAPHKEKENAMNEKCKVCNKEIEVQIMKNTGLCGENCRKVHDKESDRPKAQTDAGITNLLNRPGSVDPRGIV